MGLAQGPGEHVEVRGFQENPAGTQDSRGQSGKGAENPLHQGDRGPSGPSEEGKQEPGSIRREGGWSPRHPLSRKVLTCRGPGQEHTSDL